MAGPSVLEPTPNDLGVAEAPAFAVTPDPTMMFAARAERFRTLSAGHALADYLMFLAALSQAQHDVIPGLPDPTPPSPDAIERAYGFSMPPIDRGRFEVDETASTTLARILDKMVAVPMPEPAAAARDRLARDPELRRKALADALDGSAIETLAEHVFASAALQVHFSRLSSRLIPGRLSAVGVGVCPCCGGPPVASLVVGWTQVHGVRYVACALCGTLWNHVRVKCVACDSTEGVGYSALSPDDGEVEDASAKRRDDRAPVKAETCDACKSYVKILHQHLIPEMDPVADDVATLGLDLKLREAGWARAAFNPYLLGY